jgi:propanediol dehydratase large subunit
MYIKEDDLPSAGAINSHVYAMAGVQTRQIKQTGSISLFIKSLSLLHASSRNILYLRKSADVQRLVSGERNLSRESTYRHGMSEKKKL